MREHVSAEEGEVEGKAEVDAPLSREPDRRLWAPSQDLEIMTLSRRQPLNHLRHPGPPHFRF